MGPQGPEGLKGDIGLTGNKGDKGDISDAGVNIWYESWDLTTEKTTTNFSPRDNYIYFHGFTADTTGAYTNITFRIHKISWTNNALGTAIVAGIYSSYNTVNTNYGSAVGKPIPWQKLTSGSKVTTVATTLAVNG